MKLIELLIIVKYDTTIIIKDKNDIILYVFDGIFSVEEKYNDCKVVELNSNNNIEVIIDVEE